MVLLDELLSNLTVVGFLLEKKVFTYSFLIIGFLGIIYVCYKLLFASETKGELLKRIEAKRLKLFGKDNQNKSLKFIEMTEIKKDESKSLKAESTRKIRSKK